MTESDTMTYICVGLCVRPCSPMHIYVWACTYIGQACATVCVKKTLMSFKKIGKFLQTSPPFEKSPVCFYVRADGITFHQIGHSFFSVHPYILIKTCGQPPANNERVSLHSHFSHTSQAVFKSAFSIFFTERCFKMKGG